MKTPRLQWPITIQQKSGAQDSFGQPVNTWVTYVSCFAEIDIQNSALIYNTAEFMEKVVYRITIPWTSQFVFTPAMRIRHTDAAAQTHTYSIESIVNLNSQNRYFMFLCYELNGAQ